ncbi:MAG: AMP-binding protein [Oligoflexales bacterium]|nr:AMP-binding protein [Oligoflexales bacterium]
MDKIWLKSYPKGVPAEVNVNEYKHLADLIETNMLKYADRPAYSNMGSSISFAELDRQSAQFAGFFQNQLGLKKGDRIAIMMPNLLQYPVVLFAAIRAGLCVANVNPLYTPRELKYQLQDCGAKAIVVLDNFAHVLEKVIADTPIESVILTKVGDMLKFPVSVIANIVTRYVKKMVPAFSLPKVQVHHFKNILGNSAFPASFKKPSIASSDLVFLQYTGGTTGVSKGAMISHANICANISQAYAWFMPSIDVNVRQIVITPLPLYHMFALMANCLVFTTVGGENVLITNPRDIPGLIKELKKWPFTVLTGVNTLFNALLHHEEFRQLDFSHLQFALGGGMACQRAVAERWKQVTGKVLMEAYGLTEASPGLTMNPFDQQEFTGFVGLPLPNTVVEIRDDDGKPVPPNTPGEIYAKGPQIMQGYWNKPEETQQTITADGWLRTGDIAIMDERGYVKLVDRKKDMIIVSGFNVYPNEVEDVIAMHPAILEAAVIGVPSEHSGEAVKVIAVRKDQKFTEEALIKFCRENLTAYKVPKVVEFRTELPKTNVGKILRRALREENPVPLPY